jgi:hypothetical protein
MGYVTKSHDTSAKKFQNEGGNFATTKTNSNTNCTKILMQIAPDKNHYLENVYMTSQAKFCANRTTAINIFPDANRIPAKFGANCTA